MAFLVDRSPGTGTGTHPCCNIITVVIVFSLGLYYGYEYGFRLVTYDKCNTPTRALYSQYI